MFKTFLFSLCFCFGLQVSFSQNQPDPRLLAKFSQSKLDDLEINNNASLAFWNYYLNKSYFVLDVGIKTADYENLSTITAMNPQTGLLFDVSNENPANHLDFNPLKFNVPQLLNRRSAYKINNTQIVVFYSKKELLEKFKETL